MMMKSYLVAFIILLSNCLFGQEHDGKKRFEFRNGRWFNGSGFVQQTVYSIDGLITLNPPAEVDSIIDLSNGFIVPPYGEAHNHNLEFSSSIRDKIDQYLNKGIYYVKNPSNTVDSRDKLRPFIYSNESVDGSFSNMGFTSPGGHPSLIGVAMVDRGVIKELNGPDGFVIQVDDIEDVESIWPTFMATQPDFVKIFLLMTEKQNELNRFVGSKGLNPGIVPSIVAKAHESNLRVSAHVESSYDFHVAVRAGVDEINHLPGFRGDPALNLKTRDFEAFKIKLEDAILAAENNVTVVTTIGETGDIRKIKVRKELEKVFVHNLMTLKTNGVRIAIGSDSYDHISINELFYLEGLNVFTNLELINMLCENTAYTIFPTRKIGKLIEGFEANFLVLCNDPLNDLAALKEIELKVKGGLILR